VLRSIGGLIVTNASHQVQDFASEPSSTYDPKVKYVLVAAYQKDGRTVVQPLTAEQDAEKIAELFRNKTLEVWLSNGKNDIAQFDVAIAKYKQVLQPLTRCQKVKTKVCMKNHFRNLVSCEQCPMGINTGGIPYDEC
jgi:hypothetical protein